MKKLTTLLIAIFMIITVSGCSNVSIDKKGLELYKTAINNLEKYKSADIDVKVLMEEKEQNIVMKITSSSSFINEGKLQVSGNVSAAISGIKMDNFIKFYFKNDNFYMNVMEEKIATPFKSILDQYLSQQDVSVSKNENPEKGMRKLTLEEKDGKQYLHIEFNEILVNEVLKKAEGMNSGMDDASLSKYEVDFIITKDGMIEQLNMYMNPKYTYSGKSMNLDLNFTIDFKNINNVKDIKFPDFKGYKLPSEEQMKELLTSLESSTVI